MYLSPSECLYTYIQYVFLLSSLDHWINYYFRWVNKRITNQCQYFLLCLTLAALHLFVWIHCPFYAISYRLSFNAGTKPHPHSAAVICCATPDPVYFNAVHFGGTDEVIGAVRGVVNGQMSGVYEAHITYVLLFFKLILDHLQSNSAEFCIRIYLSLIHSCIHFIWK